MKNELYIEMDGGNYFYLSTNEDSVINAAAEFMSLCRRIGLNGDNVRYTAFELRSKNGEVIETMKVAA